MPLLALAAIYLAWRNRTILAVATAVVLACYVPFVFYWDLRTYAINKCSARSSPSLWACMSQRHGIRYFARPSITSIAFVGSLSFSLATSDGANPVTYD
jgi:hypothetical protein